VWGSGVRVPLAPLERSLSSADNAGGRLSSFIPLSRWDTGVMTFTVTHRSFDQLAEFAVTDFGGDDSYSIHESGALVIVRAARELIYAPGSWFLVEREDGQEDGSPGNYM
jgi:hypothetical protein